MQVNGQPQEWDRDESRGSTTSLVPAKLCFPCCDKGREHGAEEAWGPQVMLFGGSTAERALVSYSRPMINSAGTLCIHGDSVTDHAL